MILLIDNFDSFVYNLARMFEELGRQTQVIRNNAIDVEGILALEPEAVVISPGPCDPPAAGISLDVVRRLGSRIPTLGVCLGHQTIAAAYGGEVARGDPVHGRATWIHHDGREVFREVPNPFRAARYHSLVVSPNGLPAQLKITAWSDDGVVMALQHAEHPVCGIQFHPESILTEWGRRILSNFLRLPARPANVRPAKEWPERIPS